MERSGESKQPTPWWLSGHEMCEHCTHEYVLEAGYYCVECDSPVCPLCVVEVTETHTVYCPQCNPQKDS